MIAPARLAAYDVLMAISAGRSDLPTALAAARKSLPDERDRALTAEIATGVQRWRATLDHLIVTFSKREIHRLDPEVVEILRLSAYQLLHLTRVPASAVVDDAVKMVKRTGQRSATGFVNAVLRTLSRKRASLPLPPRPANPDDRDAALDFLSITLSHPRWLAARWYDRVGLDAAESWMRFNNAPAPVTLRANRLENTREELAARLAPEEIRVRPARFAPDGLIVEEGHPLRGDGQARGWFVVQDEASQLVSLLAAPHPGSRVLDTCAAPGGKTTAMAAAMHGDGLLVACDARGRRMDLLRATVRAARASNVRFVQADLLSPLPFSTPFDCVLVDAPCSGLGTLRRDPDIKWRRHELELAALAFAQTVMLHHAAAVVAPGGRLVYATCSSEPEENEAVAAAFLAHAPEFSAVTPDLPDLIDEDGHLHTWPYMHGLEAFFGAVFVRRKL